MVASPSSVLQGKCTVFTKRPSGESDGCNAGSGTHKCRCLIAQRRMHRNDAFVPFHCISADTIYRNSKCNMHQIHSYIAALDVRLQKCIEKHKDLLASMTIDEATSRQVVVDQILARVQELDSMASDLFQDEQQDDAVVEKEEPAGRSIRLAAVSVSVNEVHALLLRQCHENNNKSSLQSFQMTVLQKSKPEHILTGSHCPDRRFIPNTHVTLAHCKSVPQHVLQETYGPWQGRKVQVQPIALLWSDSVAAIEVTLSSSDGNVPETMNEFVHVTVWCQDGSLAVEANELPGQIEQGSAQRFDLADAASIAGTVKLWK